MKRNIVRPLIAVLLLVMSVLPVNAFAKGTTPYAYSFSDDQAIMQSDYSTKNDTEQYWYVSIHAYNPKYQVNNNVSSTNILGVRMKKLGNIDGYDHNNIGSYEIFKGIGNYPKIPYLYYATTDMFLYINRKKDNRSTSSATLYASGNFTP